MIRCERYDIDLDTKEWNLFSVTEVNDKEELKSIDYVNNLNGCTKFKLYSCEEVNAKEAYKLLDKRDEDLKSRISNDVKDFEDYLKKIDDDFADIFHIGGKDE